MEHAQIVTKCNIQNNINKEEDYLIYLKRNFQVDEQSNIDSYDVLMTF